MFPILESRQRRQKRYKTRMTNAMRVPLSQVDAHLLAVLNNVGRNRRVTSSNRNELKRFAGFVKARRVQMQSNRRRANELVARVGRQVSAERQRAAAERQRHNELFRRLENLKARTYANLARGRRL